MDTFFAIARRLIGLVALAVLGVLVLPSSADAATYDQAMASCGSNFAATTAGGRYTVVLSCQLIETHHDSTYGTAGTVGYKIWLKENGTPLPVGDIPWSGPWSFTGVVPPVNPCLGMSSASIYQSGVILQGSSTCVRGPVQSNGAQAMCGATLTPIGRPTRNPYSGEFETYISFVPTGQVCGEGHGDSAGLIEGPDGSPNPAPPIPDPVPPTLPVPPKICAGTSCYDSGSDNVCTSGGGGTACVPGGTAAGAPGGCATSGDVTICAGSPNPPLPDPGNVPDPAGQAVGNDGYTQANPVTGATSTTTVTIYSGGSSVSSGASSTDHGAPQQGTGGGGTGGDPAPGSSVGDAGSFSGGTSCTVPPVCAGDAVACGAARTQWATTCQVHTDLVGDGTAQAKFDALKTKYSQSDVWVDDGTGTSDGSVGGEANQGRYDEGGFGYAQSCPLHDLDVPLWGGQHFTVEFSKGCMVGPWIRGVVLAFAFFFAGRITLGARE